MVLYKFLALQLREFDLVISRQKIYGRFDHLLLIHIQDFHNLCYNVDIGLNFTIFLVLCPSTNNHFRIVMHRILCSINLKILNQISNGFNIQGLD